MAPMGGMDPGGRFAGTGNVDLGGWLSKGWELIKDDIVTFAVATLLAGLIGSVTCGILAPAMTCGLLMMVFAKMQGRSVEIGDVFKGTRRFVPAILTALLLLVPGLAIYIVSVAPMLLVAAVAPNSQGAMALAALWCYPVLTILVCLLQGAIFFTFAHIAARNVGPVEALQASWEVFRRNLLMFTVTAVLYQVIASAGEIACIIGVFVTVPLIMAAQAQAYIDHFGMQGVSPD
jgi:hypothetical protein